LPPESRKASRRIPAILPVVLYIARFHPPFQGFSESYRIFKGISIPHPGSSIGESRPETLPVGPIPTLNPTGWAITPDGAIANDLTGSKQSLERARGFADCGKTLFATEKLVFCNRARL
jgi:hypothetical protein